MRGAFVKALAELAEQDRRILLLTGDLGYTVVEPFAERFPQRFFNAGVAEQNLMGLATGLAESGYLPFVYSISTFASMRAYEFIRNGPVLGHLPVRIVGVGGGFEYGPAGATHFSLEDIGLMRLQPGMSIVAPADYEQARTALRATWDLPQPVYFRLGKNERDRLLGLDGRFQLGRLQVVREGGDILFIALGAIASEVLIAARKLSAEGLESTVAVVASVSPAPADDLKRLLRQFPAAITVEAHYVTGGLGSLIAELIADEGISCHLQRCGVRGEPGACTGSEDYMNGLHGLSGRQLAETALRTCGRVAL